MFAAAAVLGHYFSGTQMTSVAVQVFCVLLCVFSFTSAFFSPGLIPPSEWTSISDHWSVKVHARDGATHVIDDKLMPQTLFNMSVLSPSPTRKLRPRLLRLLELMKASFSFAG